ncbi:hypothetical protein [Dyella sp. OK004]|uniref:hypothetical protein n=1 Tax=Dyella sp. OK004 TaxID=1855292 RepID=UPI0011608244|nr:hypothetical protein [Dyella sp. OK004]
MIKELSVKKQTVFTSLLAISSLAIPSLTLSETPASKAPATSSYNQKTIVFSPGATGYEAWKTWIDAQNQKNPTLRRGDGTTAVGPVGQITVNSGIEASTSIDQVSALSVPPDNGPPTPLPTTGSPGQKLTIKNQTETLYQQWTFVWVAGDAGFGGWDQQGYFANTCAPKPGMTGVLCAPSIN